VIALKGKTPRGSISWADMLQLGQAVPDGALRSRAGELQPGDAINIQYTSGTTGFPKAAMLTHRNLLLNAFYTGDCQKLGAQDRVCIPVPFYHCFGCVIGTLSSMVHGTAMVIPAETFNASATLDAVEAEKATVLYGVPTMFIAMLEDPGFGRRKLNTLRTGIMAGSPCPIEVMRKVVELMGIRQITIGYGQTESSPSLPRPAPTIPSSFASRRSAGPFRGWK